jgi:hypothetical protein
MIRKSLTSCVLLCLWLTSSVRADHAFSDSPTSPLNLLTQRGTPTTSYSDSSQFALNLLGIRRAWADSETFPWMYAEASEAPDPTVLQKTGIGTLRLLDAGHPLDVSKPTIVLTHGWNLAGDTPGTVSGWLANMRDSILAQPWHDGWNFIWWDWLERAKSWTPFGPADQAQWQGNYLASALVDTLGADYSKNIHFIGHSLGTAVNRWAVDTLHANGWSPARTHVTILDSAEIGSLANTVQPIPLQAAFVDSYITAFGDLHDKARNVILTQGMPILPKEVLDYFDYHRYSAVWYDMTIDSPSSSCMGFLWSFENGGFTGAPAEKACFIQTPQTSDPCGALQTISWADAQSTLQARTVIQVKQGVDITYSLATHPLKYLGSVLIDTVGGDTVGAKLAEVVVGSPPSYTPQAMSPMAESSASSSYLWIPIQSPYGKDLLSFDYKFTNCSAGDYLTVSIGDRQVFIMEARFVTPGEYTSSSYIDISGNSGRNIELLVAFNSDDIPGGELYVRNFQFHSTAVAMDINADGLVNFSDFGPLSAQWGRTDCNDATSWCNRCDFDRSGSVDASDVGIFAATWLRDAGDPNTW